MEGRCIISTYKCQSQLILHLLVIAVLLQYHLPYLRDFDALQLHVDGLSLGLQVHHVVLADVVEEGVVEGLGDGHALVGVELQGVQQEVFGIGSYCFEEVFEGFSGDVAEGSDVVLGTLVADEVDVFGSADDVEDYGAK